MLLDYQQGGMVLDGLITFPDWAYGGIVAEETTSSTGGTIVLQGNSLQMINIQGNRQSVINLPFVEN